ncbi:MAG: hypothetical protein Hals2KO_35850 [Halioglobus sp.]
MRHVFAVVAFSIALAANPAAGALLDFGNYTRDTIAERDWLDLTVTADLSYLEVVEQTMAGGRLSGWKIAAYVDVVQLFLNTGESAGGFPSSSLPSGVFVSATTGNEALYRVLVPLWGETRPSVNPLSRATYFNLFDSRPGDVFFPGMWMTLHQGRISYTNRFGPADEGYSFVGTALYREALPLAPTWWFFGIALVSGLFFRVSAL